MTANSIDTVTSRSINIAKSILLAGVVMIHSNPLQHDVSDSVAVNFTFDSIGTLLSFCVPYFFIISGYLFYANITDFTYDIYKRKLQSRLYSIVIPYILWCTIYGIVRFFKAKYLGYDGDGICDNGAFSITGFIKGYWNTGDGYPMGFVLWFLRNLIIFQLLTPLVTIFGRYWILTVAVICLPLFGIKLYGLEYFVFGSALGIHKINLTGLYRKHIVASAFLLLIIAVTCGRYCQQYMPLVIYVGFIIFLPFCDRLFKLFPQQSKFILHHSNAFFFIYAVHGLYCTMICKIYISLFGINSLISAIGCFTLSLMTNIILSVSLYILTLLVSKRMLNILSGMRINN